MPLQLLSLIYNFFVLITFMISLVCLGYIASFGYGKKSIWTD